MGLGPDLETAHRFSGLRSHGFGKTLELSWPEVEGLPNFGYVMTRKDLDMAVAHNAVTQGVELIEHTEATEPIYQDGHLVGVVATDTKTQVSQSLTARYIVLADGANSRLGRAMGTVRNRKYPLGMAIRGYYASPLDKEDWIDSWLDIKDRNGHSLPGYGWIFPVGDGRVNVGIGLLSTFSQWKSVNTTHLMNAFVESAPPQFELRAENACGPATGGRLPMGLSISPRVGSTWVGVGDAIGAINPFNGEGIAYGYETGRMAAEAISKALNTRNGLALTEYDRALQETYGLYFKTARAFVRVIGRPELMKTLAGTGMRSRTLMEWVLRIMANLMRPEERGPAELAYKAVEKIAAIAP